MTEYAICFDFPNQPDPLFAHQGSNKVGHVFSTRLSDAILFDSEAEAERYLERYGPDTRKWGAVVEMGQPA